MHTHTAAFGRSYAIVVASRCALVVVVVYSAYTVYYFHSLCTLCTLRMPPMRVFVAHFVRAYIVALLARSLFIFLASSTLFLDASERYVVRRECRATGWN